MANRSLNKVMLIGNLTRDPELRYTPAGVPVCSFGLATNRSWTTQTGEQKEEAQFHQIVAWNKLAELCSQLLRKGRKVYVEGRLQYREWTGSDGNKQRRAEVVITDMMILDLPKEEDRRVETELDKAAEYTSSEEAEGEISEEVAAEPAEPQAEPIEEPSKTGEGEGAESETESAQNGEGKVISDEVVEEASGGQTPEASQEAETKEGEESSSKEGEEEEKMPF